MDCPMNASRRLIFSAVSSVFVSVLVLVTVFFFVFRPEGEEPAKAPGGRSSLIAEGEAAKEKGNYADALAAFQKALALTDKEKNAKDWSDTATSIARMHHRMASWKDAEELYSEIFLHCEKFFGPRDQMAADALTDHADMLHETKRLAEAEPLYRRALAINEAGGGKDHPNVARVLRKLAVLLIITNRLEEAEVLLRRALAIDEAAYGKDEHQVTKDLNSLASLLESTNRQAEAEPLMRRVMGIMVDTTDKTGHTNANLEKATVDYRRMLVKMGETEAVIEEKIARIMEPISKK